MAERVIKMKKNLLFLVKDGNFNDIKSISFHVESKYYANFGGDRKD